MFAGGMLGLFLLGFIVKKAGNAAAITAVIIGVTVIFWMSSAWVPKTLKPMLHGNLTIVIGTLTIFLIGLILSRFFQRSET